MQGQKAAGRLQAVVGLRAAMAGALDLLGLQRNEPGVLLAELRTLALVRCLLASKDLWEKNRKKTEETDNIN